MFRRRRDVAATPAAPGAEFQSTRSGYFLRHVNVLLCNYNPARIILFSLRCPCTVFLASLPPGHVLHPLQQVCRIIFQSLH